MMSFYMVLKCSPDNNFSAVLFRKILQKIYPHVTFLIYLFDQDEKIYAVWTVFAYQGRNLNGLFKKLILVLGFIQENIITIRHIQHVK